MKIRGKNVPGREDRNYKGSELGMSRSVQRVVNTGQDVRRSLRSRKGSVAMVPCGPCKGV